VHIIGTVSTPIGYAGAYTDSETGLLYLINRYYDPATGQFLTLDPDVATTHQPYVYADDDPENEVDPSGDDPSGDAGGANVGRVQVQIGKPNLLTPETWAQATPPTLQQGLGMIYKLTVAANGNLNKRTAQIVISLLDEAALYMGRCAPLGCGPNMPGGAQFQGPSLTKNGPNIHVDVEIRRGLAFVSDDDGEGC
jgi:RHS repeat-associated protein